MALSTGKKTVKRDSRSFVFPVKAGAVCIQGGLAILAAGLLRPGREGQGGNVTAKANDAATYAAVGVFQETVTGGVGDGDVKALVEANCWAFKNSAGVDAITLADVGKPAFVVDDETVSRTSGQGVRCRAGIVRDLDADGVWIEVGPFAGAGKRSVLLPFAINETDTLAGTSAELVSPVAGEIIGLSVIVQKAVTTGGDVTVNNVATPVVGLACTIADAATKGTVVSDTPTAGDATTVVAAGGRIQVVPAAAFNTGGAVSGFVEIAY